LWLAAGTSMNIAYAVTRVRDTAWTLDRYIRRRGWKSWNTSMVSFTEDKRIRLQEWVTGWLKEFLSACDSLKPLCICWCWPWPWHRHQNVGNCLHFLLWWGLCQLEMETAALWCNFKYAMGIYGLAWSLSTVTKYDYYNHEGARIQQKSGSHHASLDWILNALDRTKHVQIKYHLAREQSQQENIMVKKVPTKENIAEPPTKQFHGDAFWQHMTGCLVLIHADIEL